ncbi:hypothetical protein DSUL_50135 [Desulfovibrionales bacterium]
MCNLSCNDFTPDEESTTMPDKGSTTIEELGSAMHHIQPRTIMPLKAHVFRNTKNTVNSSYR